MHPGFARWWYDRRRVHTSSWWRPHYPHLCPGCPPTAGASCCHGRKARVSEDDILERARKLRGVERLEQIEYAVLERSGTITVIPQPGTGFP